MAQGAEQVDWASIKQLVAARTSLQPAQYAAIIDAARTGTLAAGAPEVVGAPQDVDALTLPNVTEQLLVTPQRHGVIVALTADDQPRTKKRKSVLADGVSYSGGSFGGRVTPEPAQEPVIGKTYATLKRLQGGQCTHKFSVVKVKQCVRGSSPPRLLEDVYLLHVSSDRLQAPQPAPQPAIPLLPQLAAGMAPLGPMLAIPQLQQQQEQQPSLVDLLQGDVPVGPADSLLQGLLGSLVEPSQGLQQQPQAEQSAQSIGRSAGGGGGGSGEQATGTSSPPPDPHFTHLTVGGPQPAAGQGALASVNLVVDGEALVRGTLRAQQILQISDSRLKEDISMFDDARMAVRLAERTTVFVYRFKGQERQQLGYVAQQLQSAVEACRAEHLGVVVADNKGRLSLNLTGLVAVLHQALRATRDEVREMRKAHGSVLLAAVGALDSRARSRLARLGRPDAPGSAGASELPAALEQLRQLEGEDAADSWEVVDAADEDEEMSDAAEAQSEGGTLEPPRGMFAGLSPPQAARLLAEKLDEPSNIVLFEKFARQLEPDELEACYRRATEGPGERTSDNAREKTVGGAFISKAKQAVAQQRRRAAPGSAGPAPEQLRGYQRALLAAVRAGGNHVVVLPTGAGKTAVATSLSEELLLEDSSRRVVLIAPTVSLADQQAGAFLRCPSFADQTLRVGCFTGDAPVNAQSWPSELQKNHVLVMTPQLLLNVLDAGAASFEQIHLLVVDECHWARAQSDHAMARIMRHYKTSAASTKVLGLTAAPSSKSTLAGSALEVQQILEQLDATLLTVDAKNQELREIEPQVAEERILVKSSPADDELARRLGAFTLAALDTLKPRLEQLADQEAQHAARVPANVREMLQQGIWSSSPGRWAAAQARQLTHPGQSAQARDLCACLRLMRGAVAALALVSDAGYEAAVRLLSTEYAAAADKVVVQGAANSAGADEDSSASSAIFPGAREMLEQVAGLLPADVVEDAQRSAVEGHSRHPKFAELTKLLQRWGSPDSSSEFHGIIFVRTRAGASAVAKLLANSPQLAFIDSVHLFTGHGGGASVGGPRGMTVKEQQRVMQAFRASGRRLLVSTAAAEEGIDVPTCEAVIRYSATMTGRERVQARGRARRLHSAYVELLDANAQELGFAERSRLQEANMHAVMAGMNAVRVG